ncbi:S-adenosyl-L-methionine-dependent methyltransferase [Nemania sp. FL0916]|nr:S-adenosyl-L-methionine-dependent methyltransferase [Nemania sp. FL0916]
MASAWVNTYVQSGEPGTEYGFNGADWSAYRQFRPLYPLSFYKRIFDYHSTKAGASPDKVWSKAMDIGAGAGIVSFQLAKVFDHVIVSDPNDGYAALAKKLLVDQEGFRESKFTFLQEDSEHSSVPSGTVNLITVAECIHWMDPERAIKEFARQLVPGGTLAITFYHIPLIEGNERAEKASRKIWNAWALGGKGEFFDKIFAVINRGLESVGFPEEDWKDVKRTYINCQRGYEVLEVDRRISPSQVKDTEQVIWEEKEDEDWCYTRGFKYFQEYMDTFPYNTTKEDLPELWKELEDALDGKEVRIKFPAIVLLATKK